MFKKLFILFLLSILFVNCNSAKKARIATTLQGQVANENYIEKITFDYYMNLIFIPIEINGKTYQFLFDTGNDLTAIDDQVSLEINSSSNNVSGKIFDAHKSSRVMEHVSIKKLNLGNVEFQNIGAQVSDLSSLSEILGCKNIDGIIGSNLIRKAKWQIDYKQKTLSFSDKLNSLIQENESQAFQDMGNNSNKLKFEIALNDLKDNYLLDTGFNGFVTGNNLMFEKIINESEKQYIKSESLVFGAFSKNVSQKYHCTIETLKFPSLKLENQTVDFYDTDPKFGNLFLENFLFTIDWNNRKIYLEQVNPVESDYIHEFEVGFKPNYFNETIEITRIWENSIPELKIGTKIIQINSINVSKFNTEQLCEFWERNSLSFDETNKIIIEILYEGKPKKIELNRKNRLSEI